MRGEIMNVRNIACVAAIAAAASVPGAAFAAATATAITDLNIRSGPGPQYPVIGAIRTNDQATITGCIQGSLWCEVTYGGRQGWAYSQYLTAPLSGNSVVVSERREAIGVPTVAYETTGAAEPDVVVGGPIEAATGVADAAAGVADTAIDAGAALGSAVAPPPAVETYVADHPVDDVYLDSEVAVGAGLPDSVALAPIPDYRYRYVYVNRQPVLVEPSSRRIVYVYR
jgi:uncharacterized protein YraI